MKQYFKVLGLPTNANLEEVKHARNNLLKKYHPDCYKGSISFAEEKTREINEAFAKQATTPERPYSISLSMGSIQCRLSNSDSLDEFMNQIDKRMYESKKRYHEAHHLSREYE